MNTAVRLIDDLNVMVAGQGGDGSLTLATLVADLFGRRGFHLYQARNVASRIKGGHAAAYLRASIVERSCLGDQFDLLVCFDREAIEEGGPHLANDGVVVFDASEEPLPSGVVPEGVTVLEIPFGRMSVRDLRRDLYKNSLAFGVVGRLLGIPDEELETALRRNLARLAGSLIEANVLALHRGLEFADGLGLRAGETPWKLDTGTPGNRVLISGNEAAAFGFLVAGGRFFAGYPITGVGDPRVACQAIAGVRRHRNAGGRRTGGCQPGAGCGHERYPSYDRHFRAGRRPDAGGHQPRWFG